MPFDVKLYNVIVLGLCFMLIFTAFQTCGIIEQTVITSIHHDDPSFDGSGYISLAIIYGVLALANWGAPSAISLIGAKWAMIIGGVTYGLFIASFLYPKTWLLYAGSVLIGLGAACIWTGQGSFLTENSDSKTIARNSGIFWALLQCSLLFGNMFFYFTLQGKDTIDKSTRFTVFIVLLVVCSIGVLLLIALRNAKRPELKASEEKTPEEGPLAVLVRAFKLFMTKDMILLSVTFFYTGLELGFFSGVYGTAVAGTLQFGTIAKQLLGLNGIFIGVGEILGGGLFGMLGKKTNRYGRDPIVILGYVVHMAAFYLIFINIPFRAALHETTEGAYIHSNVQLAMFCSFLLGFGDSCFNTQVYSLLGNVYAGESAPAFALFKFIQSLAAAASFFYSTNLILPWQLLILVIMGSFGTITFCIVEWEVFRKNQEMLLRKRTLSSESQ